jgi:hypothetical protein
MMIHDGKIFVLERKLQQKKRTNMEMENYESKVDQLC